MFLKQYYLGCLAHASYLIADENTGVAAVVDPAFTWGDDRPPRTPWHNTVIYELHVRGFSKLHPDIP